ncbi:hypothetical protein ACFWXZ_34790 [[Kitasatospora] papulosa]|uniref:hypothetical protein n=1 Tax=[Kitasatospora] papulosa TaxID=1464011 RepID=UPI0036B4FA16
MADEPAPRRPGRPMKSGLHDLSHQSTQVRELVRALHALIAEAGVSYRQIADKTPGFKNRQALSRNVRREAGPDKHVVEALVRYSSQALGEPEDARLAHFLTLWRSAQPAGPAEADPGEDIPMGVGPVDLSQVASILLLVSDGHLSAGAALLVASHPQGGEALGQILAEVGRRTPGGVMDLLDAVTEQAGAGTADSYGQALDEADPVVATAVRAVPRTRPEHVEVPEQVAAPSPDLLQLTPQEIQGRRRARQIRAGDVAQVAAELIVEASTESVSPTGFRRHVNIRLDQDLQRPLDIDRAWQLLLDICKQDPDDEIIVASLLSQMVADGHPQFAVSVLETVHSVADEGPGYVRTIQEQMKRPTLLSALESLATGKVNAEPATLQALLVQAPPRVTAAFLLQNDPAGLDPALDICELPRLEAILRSMTEISYPATALVLARQMEKWETFFPQADGPEKKFASTFNDMARAAPHQAGLLLHVLIWQSPEQASTLMSTLERSHGEPPGLGPASDAIGAALRHDALTAGLIARAARHHRPAYHLLDRVAQNDASHATALAAAMLHNDLPHFASLLPTMINMDALVIAAEMVRQLTYRDPKGPWSAVAEALKDGDRNAALEHLKDG